MGAKYCKLVKHCFFKMFTFIGFGNYIKTVFKKWGHGPILFDQKNE